MKAYIQDLLEIASVYRGCTSFSGGPYRASEMKKFLKYLKDLDAIMPSSIHAEGLKSFVLLLVFSVVGGFTDPKYLAG